MSEAPDKDAGGVQGDEGDEKPELLKPWVAITLAAIALLGAGLAIQQTRASVNEANTAREATRTAVQAQSASVIEGSVQQLESDLVAEDAFIPFREPFLEGGGPLLLAGGAEPATEAQRQAAIRATEEALPTERTEAALRGLEQDSAFLSLKQSALAETRGTWNDRSTQYTTVIAFLAVALFLVGFALVVGGPLRPVFYAIGIVFALVCLGWGAYIHSLSIPETPDPAIEATARGQVETGAREYGEAVASFDIAVDEDGDYAPAYASRAIARILAANPDFVITGAVTEENFGAAEGAIDDAVRALELNDRDSVTYAVLSLIAFYAGEYDQSIAAADEAIAINGEVPDSRLVKSASQLGLGDPDAASETLNAAFDLLDDAQPSPRTRALVSDYVNYMEWLIVAEPDVAEEAAAFEQFLVAAETGFNLDRELSGEAPARGTARVQDLRFENGRLRLTIAWNNLPPNTALTALGFERPIADRAWSQPADSALFRSVGGSGRQVVDAELQRVCKPTGVRVDLYLNGERVQTETGPGVRATCP